MKKIFLIFFLFFFFLGNTYAKTFSDSQLKGIYFGFIHKVEKKYDKKYEINILEKLKDRINYILLHKKLSRNTKSIIERLGFLNKNYLSNLLENKNKLLNNNSGVNLSKVTNDLSINYQNQLKLEAILRNHFKKISENFVIENYIKKIKNTGKKFYYLNNYNSFVEDDNIYKIIFSRYYKINSGNYTQFYDKDGILVYSKKLGYIFLNDYKIEKKIPYSQSNKYVLGVVSNKIKFILGNDGYYYFYKFSNYSHISDIYGFYLSDLKRFGYNPSNILVYIDSNHKFNFVSKYKKIKLVSKEFISDIGNKQVFLNILSDDYKFLNYYNSDYDEELLEIKEITNKLTKGVNNNDEKIKLIYNWILSNIRYTTNFKLTDYRIFSGLDTFKYKNGVCEGYVKLMGYMLLFSGINDFNIIRGYVIDAKDFPQIGHAWLRIGDKYYDPTFDDPIGATDTKKFEEYKYFALPKDLFYTNRYDYGKLPEYIKTLSLEKRKQIIFNNLVKLVDKYSGKNYLILKPFEFRKKYNLPLKQLLNISDLKNIVKYFYVDNYKFYDRNSKKRYITSIVYYPVNNNTIERVLADNFNYNINGLYLFKWKDSNGNITYRLTNKVTIK